MKKNYQYQHLSTETLKEKRDSLLKYISEQEEMLLKAESKLLQLLLTYYVKTAKEELHVIEAELCFREHNN